MARRQQPGDVTYDRKSRQVRKEATVSGTAGTSSGCCRFPSATDPRDLANFSVGSGEDKVGVHLYG